MHRDLPRCYLNIATEPCDLKISRAYDLVVKSSVPWPGTRTTPPAVDFIAPVSGEYASLFI